MSNVMRPTLADRLGHNLESSYWDYYRTVEVYREAQKRAMMEQYSDPTVRAIIENVSMRLAGKGLEKGSRTMEWRVNE